MHVRRANRPLRPLLGKEGGCSGLEGGDLRPLLTKERAGVRLNQVEGSCAQARAARGEEYR